MEQNVESTPDHGREIKEKRSFKRSWFIFPLLAHELILLAATFFPHKMGTQGEGFSGLAHGWLHWDSLWFISIGQYGYTHLPIVHGLRAVAFFPLVPSLVHLTGPWKLVLIEQLVLVFDFLLLKTLSKRMGLTESQSIKAVWLFALNPAAIFYSTIYAEPWTLLCTLASVYFGTKRRWVLAGLMGALTSLTEGSAILVGIFPLVLFIKSIIERKGRQVMGALVWGVGCALGLVAYMVYLGISVHDPLAFSHVQSTLWSAHWYWPWVVFVRAFDQFGLSNHAHRLTSASLVMALIFTLGVLLTWFLPRVSQERRWERTATILYVTAGFLVAMSFYPHVRPFQSGVRIASVFYPMYMGFACRLPNWLLALVALCFIAVGFWGTNLFTHGIFFQ